VSLKGTTKKNTLRLFEKIAVPNEKVVCSYSEAVSAAVAGFQVVEVRFVATSAHRALARRGARLAVASVNVLVDESTAYAIATL